MNWKLLIMKNSTAVSYKHLDVYKRHYQTTPCTVTGSCIQYAIPAGAKDVYKRQIGNKAIKKIATNIAAVALYLSLIHI